MMSAIVRVVCRALLGTVIAAACLGCPSPIGRDSAAGSDACIVAEGDGFAIQMSDVEVMRQQIVPPPPRDDAVRMTVDAWLAEWIVTSRLGAAAPAVRRGYHHELVNLLLEDRRREIQRAATAVNLRLGPCHPDGSSG